MAETQDAPSSLSELHLKRQKQEKDDLIAQLDNLLERYLHTLDEYEKVQRQLSKQLSSGFLSLAQANFHNSSLAIRYGQDCYDERMQATRKVAITDKTSPTGTRSFFSIFPEQNDHDNSKSKETKTSREKQSLQEDSQDRSDLDKNSSTTPTSYSVSEPTSKEDMNSSEAPEETKTSARGSTKSTDPLRWFGILVPPALRTAQSTFVGAVEGPIPQLATIARDLRNQEIEIGRLRKHLKKL